MTFVPVSFTVCMRSNETFLKEGVLCFYCIVVRMVYTVLSPQYSTSNLQSVTLIAYVGLIENVVTIVMLRFMYCNTPN